MAELSKSAVTKETGIRHFFAAAGYSWGGFVRVLHEAAFRQELLFCVVALVILALVGATLPEILVSVFLFLGLFAIEAMNTAVEAPGDAPSNATSEQSAAATSSVPNSRNPPRRGSGLMICTRCPATSSCQSAGLARG